jgi:hypothetical protein
MKIEVLVLEGTQGLAAGSRYAISRGAGAMIGRGSDCDLCLKGLPRYQALSEEERKSDKAFQAISRRHLRIAFVDAGRVELESHGRHGTQLDGRPFGSALLTDIRETPHTLALGPRETFILRWEEIEDGGLPMIGRPL